MQSCRKRHNITWLTQLCNATQPAPGHSTQGLAGTGAASPVHGLSCGDKVCAGAGQAGVLCFGMLILDIMLFAQSSLKLILALILRNDLHKLQRAHTYGSRAFAHSSGRAQAS